MRTFTPIAVAAFALLTSAGAHAQMVVFDNSGGEFDWEALYPNDGLPGHHLNITMGTNQDGVSPDHGILYVDDSPVTSSTPGYISLWRGDMSVRFAAGGYENWPAWNDEYQVNFATAFNAGDEVGASAEFQNSADLYIYFWDDQAPDAWFGNLTPPTSNVFVGIELTLDTGVHFGWIEFEPVYFGAGFFGGWTPESWGYQSTPGAAAIVPAPGAAIIGCAVLAGLRRRR